MWICYLTAQVRVGAETDFFVGADREGWGLKILCGVCVCGDIIVQVFKKLHLKVVGGE